MRRSRNSTSKPRKQYIWVECKHCGYRWQYTGSSNYATCPSCGGKTPVVPYINSINSLFRKLKENIATSDEERAQLELLRVLLLKYAREKRLDPVILGELMQYAKQDSKYIEEASHNW